MDLGNEELKLGKREIMNLANEELKLGKREIMNLRKFKCQV
jgi:hypothetical protein